MTTFVIKALLPYTNYSVMKILQHILTIALTVIAHTTAWAATDMGDIWGNIPQNIVPTIEANRRMDMTDLYRAGQPARATTLLGSEAQITVMGDSYMAVRLSESNILQIKSIETAKGSLYIVIRTIYAPAASSSIEIYDHNWQRLDSRRYLPALNTGDFIIPTTDNIQRDEILATILIPTIEYTMNEATNDIVAHATFEQTLDADTYRSISSSLQLFRTLQWNSKKWKLITIQ